MKEEVEKTAEQERANTRKYQAQLVQKNERLKYLEKKEAAPMKEP